MNRECGIEGSIILDLGGGFDKVTVAVKTIGKSYEKNRSSAHQLNFPFYQ
jgi:hypothetical protein